MFRGLRGLQRIEQHPLVIAHQADDMLGLGPIQPAHGAENRGAVRPAVDIIPEEDEAAAAVGGMVGDPLQQRIEEVGAAVDVADDIGERTGFHRAIVHRAVPLRKGP